MRSNELVAPIHPKAIITILRPDDHERWLTGSYEAVQKIAKGMIVGARKQGAN